METTTKALDLKQFKFPDVTGVGITFPTFNTIPELLNEAERRGFLYGHTPYNKLFSTLFFSGGRVQFKTDVDEAFRKNAWVYLRGLIGSYSPKHEHKEAVCAMILSEICEPELQKS